MRTQQEIDQEIAALEELKPHVISYNVYGDDYQAGLDAQINVLKNGLESDEIHETYGDSREELDDSDYSTFVYDQALEARQWVDGEILEAPSVWWGKQVA